ncbi:hypothetical protein Dimus_022355 [Dionaea muscipula]
MDLSGILKVVSESGEGHIVKNFQPLLDLTTEAAAGTSEVQVKTISRKKNPAASGSDTAVTIDMADVERTDVSSEGTVSNTQESEAVIKKRVTRPRLKPLRKKHVISPATGDNLLDIEEAAEEEDEEEETLVARSRPVLPKTTFDGAQGADEEETDLNEVVGKGKRIKRRYKEIDEIFAQALQHPFISESLITLDVLVQEQIEENPPDRASGSDVAASIGDEKEEDEVEKDDSGDEDVGQREGKRVVVAEEEAEAEEEEDNKSDETERPMTKKYHLGVLARRR